MAKGSRGRNRYEAIIERLFSDGYRRGCNEIEFTREDLARVAGELGIALPKNLGDVIYSNRFRTNLPELIVATQPPGLEWSIRLAGRGLYRFRLGRPSQIVPNRDLLAIKVPDSTPEIVNAYALSDEQALLAIVRYNRLVDIFLGIAAYSLQNHLRTTVPNIGQIEIDEVYMGLDRRGRQYIVPVQAKGGSDRLSSEQTRQDLEFCRHRFPNLICRSVSAQFLDRATVALFELAEQDGDIRIAEEKHYRLVPAAEIGEDDLRLYSRDS